MLTVTFIFFSAIFQRISTSRGQLRIQSMATCLFVCMDSCGLLYGSVSKAFFVIRFHWYESWKRFVKYGKIQNAEYRKLYSNSLFYLLSLS